MTDHELLKLQEDLYGAMDENEKTVYGMICDSILTTKYPEDYFRRTSLEEQNRHFGCHGDLVITERVREALALYLDDEQEFDAMLEDWDELPEDDEK